MKLQNIASGLLSDAIPYLDQITPAQYGMEVSLLSGSSIGQHTRHFIEFFQCLVQQASHPDGIIDYGKRMRDKRIESNPGYAISCIHDIQSKLAQLDSSKSLKLECSEYLPGRDTLVIETTLEREMMYNIEHTIHHLAIIKIGLGLVNPEIRLPRHFGIAPSTILHRKENACAQ